MPPGPGSIFKNIEPGPGGIEPGAGRKEFLMMK